MPLLPLVRQSSPGDYNGARMLNYYWVPASELQRGGTLQRNGLTRQGVLAFGQEVRAITDLDGVIYAACGGFLWSYNNGTVTKHGAIPDGPTTMAVMQDSILLTAGGNFHVHTVSTNLTEVVSTGQVDTAVACASMDGYALVAGTDATRRDRVAYSALDNPKSFSGLDFFTAENTPDGLVGLLEDHGYLYLFGSKDIELWYASGSNPPFVPNAGAVIEEGVISATIAKADAGIYMLTQDHKVRRTFGGGAEIVSSGEVSEYLQGKTILGAFAYDDRGRDKYVVRLEGLPSLALDIPTGLWSEFSTGGSHDPWIAACATQVGGVEYIGTTNGTICTSSGVMDETEVFRREVWSTPIEERYTSVGSLIAQMNTGLGELGRERKVNLEVSENGRTWSQPLEIELGDLGDHKRMAEWTGLGTFEDFAQFKIWITDPVLADINGVMINA